MIAMFCRVFGEGFRVFFIAAGLYGVFAMIVWEGWLGVHAAGGMVSDMPFSPVPHIWHGHEMIFGYATAALGGAFLTAVPNWTGAPAVRRQLVMALAGLWLAGRLAIWTSASLPAGLVATVDLAFLPALGATITAQLLRRPKPQNILLLGALAMLWGGNLRMHADWMGWSWGDAVAGLRAGLLGVVAMIAMLGGRVTPAFTRNAMQRAGQGARLPKSFRPVEFLSITTAMGLPAAYLFGLPDVLTGALAVLAGVLILVRLSGWRSLWALNLAILWPLHLAYAFLGLGYLALGLSVFGTGSEVAGLHLLGIGAVGGMTLAMMSRASLGHTGRQLILPEMMVPAFLLVALAAGLRWAGSVWPGVYYPMVLGAGAAWIVAFALFLTVLGPILLGPRQSAPQNG
ncbi:NnrS family protein [Phaeovulum sp.]|uniref:NnrS family protein n=1 Tax=Phaeovulum sp. TaxID=2934796 RepID=UPI0039E28E5F